RKKKTSAPASSTIWEELAWVPMKEDWDPQGVKVEAVERGDSGKLIAYIRFKNGEQLCVGMDKVSVHRHCPRPMLRFFGKHHRIP
ncbi:uncharacterized protein A1O9_00042, partial [Exophiala aquamarina CBS 119918]